MTSMDGSITEYICVYGNSGKWKKPRTKVRNLIKMEVPENLAMQAGNTRR